MSSPQQQRGALMITAIVILITLSLLSAVATRLFISQSHSSGDFLRGQEALLLAESGMEKAKYELVQSSAYSGEINTAFANGTFTITILYTDFTGLALPAGQARISSTGTITTINGQLINRTVEEIITVPILVGWAVGKNGSILRWNGNQWLLISNPFSFNLNDVYCISNASNCWFVGDGGEIAHWDGLAFTSSTVTGQNLNAVSCEPDNPTLCFAVGDSGTLAAWNGSSWTVSTWPSGQNLHGLHCPDNNCYAVGDNGTILHYSGGWNDESSGTVNLNDVHCSSGSDCWAVGDRDGNRFYTLNRSAPANWSINTLNSNQRRHLLAVSCTAAPGSCWALGQNGRTLLNTGGAWSLDSSGSNANFNDLWCSQTNTECWATGGAAGGQNTLLHWQGAAWTNTTSPTTPTEFMAIHFAPDADSPAEITTLAWREAMP